MKKDKGVQDGPGNSCAQGIIRRPASHERDHWPLLVKDASADTRCTRIDSMTDHYITIIDAKSVEGQGMSSVSRAAMASRNLRIATRTNGLRCRPDP